MKLRGTCIVGVEHNRSVYMGCDTLATSAYEKCTLADAGKVYRLGEEIMIGTAGSVRIRDVIRYEVVPPTRSEAEKDDQRYIVTQLVPEIREKMKAAGILSTESGIDEAAMDALIGYRGKLYVMDESLCVVRVSESFWAVGSGGDYALGSLHSTRSVKDPKARIRTALDAASKFSPSCAPPFHIEKL